MCLWSSSWAQVVFELSGVRLEKDGYVILDHVDWTVRQGEAWSLKGLNGAGKSSIVRLLTVSGAP
jgi:ABC-type molybdenum transport system ATPase subunit/photorepair protein PhrA